LLSDETWTITGRPGIVYSVREGDPIYQRDEVVIIKGIRYRVH